MRIALIESGVSLPEKFVYQVYPPHGLMYLTSWLRAKKPDTQIKIFDLMAGRVPEQAILEELREFSPELVGIHAMHFQAKSLHRIAWIIKQHFPVPVIAGGPYPSSEPERVLADKNIDLAVRGEGEVTFEEIVDRFEQGEDLHEIPGTAYRWGSQTVIEPDRTHPGPGLHPFPGLGPDRPAKIF